MGIVDLVTLGDIENVRRHLGSGTAFPTVGMKVGDTFQHTVLGLWVYNGTAWTQINPLRITSTARAALATTQLHQGFKVYETDTFREWVWTGAGWQGYGFHDFPIAFARQTVASSHAAGWQNVGFNLADIDTHGMWAPAAPNRLTVPAGQAGLYMIMGSVTFNSGAAAVWELCQLLVNNVVVSASWGAAMPAGGASGAAISSRRPIQLSPGDYITINGYQQNAWTTRISADGANSYLTAERIR